MKIRLVVGVALAQSVAIAACYDWSLTTINQGGPDSSLPDGTVQDDATSAPDSPAAMPDGKTGGDGEAKSDGSKDGPTRDASAPCTMGGVLCPAGQYCDFADDLCGSGIITGTCVPVPDCGTLGVDYICTCKMQAVKTTCPGGNSTGVDWYRKGGCDAAVAGGNYFGCGYRYCVRGKEFCNSSSGGSQFECVSYKSTCMTDSCQCASMLAPSCTCDGSPDAGILMTCP